MHRWTALFCALSLTASMTAVALAQEPPPENEISTVEDSVMPDVRGTAEDAAKSLITTGRGEEQKPIYADFEVRYTTADEAPRVPDKGEVKFGEVFDQEPDPGKEIESGAGDLQPVLLKVYAGPKFGSGPAACKAGRTIARQVGGGSRGSDASVQQLLGNLRPLRPRFDFKLTKAFRPADNGPSLQGVSVVGDRNCVANVKSEISSDQRAQDLFLHIQPRDDRLTFGRDWALTAGQANFFKIKVFDRAGHEIIGADVRGDVSDVGGTDFIGYTGKKSGKKFLPTKSVVKVTPKRAGTFDLVAHTRAGNGQDLWGVARIKVRERPGATFLTFLKDTFKRGPDGKFKLQFKKASAAQASPDDAQICEAYKKTTGDAECPDDVREKMTVLILDPEKPVSDDIGVVSYTESQGVEVKADDSTIVTKQGLEIDNVASLTGEAAFFHKSKFVRNAWAGIKRVGQTVVNNVIKPAVQGVARVAGEIVRNPAPLLGAIGTAFGGPLVGGIAGNLAGRFLGHAVSVGAPAGNVFRPPIGPPAFNAPSVPVQVGAPQGQPTGTQAACDFGAVIISQYAPNFLNVFKKYCQTA